MDAHENEYLAAAEAVAGDPPTRPGPAVGDQIWFKLGGGNYPRTGRVIETTPLGAIVVVTEAGDRHVVWSDEVVEL